MVVPYLFFSELWDDHAVERCGRTAILGKAKPWAMASVWRILPRHGLVYCHWRVGFINMACVNNMTLPTVGCVIGNCAVALETGERIACRVIVLLV